MRRFMLSALIAASAALCLTAPPSAQAQTAPSEAETEWFWTKLVPMNFTLLLCDQPISPAHTRFDAAYDPVYQRVKASMSEAEFQAMLDPIRAPFYANNAMAEVCPKFKEVGPDQAVNEALQR